MRFWIVGFGMLLGSLVLAGCGVDGADAVANTAKRLTFDEFEKTVPREPKTGYYIVEGDIPIFTIDELRTYFHSLTKEGALTVARVNGRDDRWNDDDRQRLSFCVSTSFGTNYDSVVRAMTEAAQAWQDAADVRFVYDPLQDSNCTASNGNVVFDVNPVSNAEYLARSFFPSTGRPQRNVLIDASSFGVGGYSLAGILRHELGHTLGLRHEHIRYEAGGVCKESGDYNPLTDYDSVSVMHYPQCNGTNTGDLVLTSLDAQGIALLYGLPSDVGAQRRRRFNPLGGTRSDLAFYRPGSGQAYVVRSNGDGSFSALYADYGLGGYDLQSPNDRVVAFDHNGDGISDFFIYRPGRGAAFVVQSNGNGSFSTVYATGDDGWGLGGYDLRSPSDRVVVFDHNGDGKDDLLFYRPGRGAAFVVQSNGNGSFSTVYATGDDGWGLGGYDLRSPSDRVVVFDHNGDGKGDLLFYRPGRGAAFVVQSNGNGSFSTVYATGDDGWGLGGYDLRSPTDRIVVFDHNGDGKDDLLFYRPGRGAAFVVQSNGNGSFSTVYATGDGGYGLGGYDLQSSSDRVVVFDHNGDGKDDLLFYRPGRGAVFVVQSNGNGSFSTVYATGDGGYGLGGYDLQSSSDRVVVFDHNGDGKDDLLFYRPGRGAAFVVQSNGNGSFSTVYATGDDGSGLGGYDLRSPNDRVLP